MNIDWTKPHWIIKRLFSNYVWSIPNTQNKIFLTFDDGPIPEITEWVLDQLKTHNAKATFFCIGDNVKKYPEVFLKIKAANHAIGNHTFNHLNGWKTTTKSYINNTLACENKLSETYNLDFNSNSDEQTTFSIQNPLTTNLFRPPYGKIKPSQSKILRKLGYKIIMWDIISYDFDATISKEDCLENVLKNVTSGSIIVFHDSKKAFQNLEFTLPRVLEELKKRKFVFEALD